MTTIAPAIDVRELGSFEIEKGIPYPTHHHNAKYPLKQMLVNESFFVPTELVRKVRAAAEKFGRLNKRRYLVRKLPNGTHRCWRTK